MWRHRGVLSRLGWAAASLSFVLMAFILVGLFVYAKLVGTERLTG